MPQNFSGQNLRGYSFKGQDLTGANFSRADLRGTNFTNAILKDANFSHALAGLQNYRIAGLLVISLVFAVVLILNIKAGLQLRLWPLIGAVNGAVAVSAAIATSVIVAGEAAAILHIVVAVLVGTFIIVTNREPWWTVWTAWTVIFFSAYVSWGALGDAQQYGLVRKVAITIAAIGGTRFCGADLTDANFTKATLKAVQFSRAKLIRTNWFQARLDFADVALTYLEVPKVRQLVVSKHGRNKNYDRLVLQGINLQDADLEDASFIAADLSEATLQNANLYRAKLVRTQLYHADLTSACLTGAYIQDWAIAPDTKVEQVECEYIYTHLPTKDDPDPCRKPDNKSENFKPGDFSDFIAPIIKTLDLYRHQNVDPRAVTLKTLDLYHHQGIDPGAAAIALQQLAANHPNAELEIIALEGRGQDKIRLQAKVAGHSDRSQLSAEYFANYSEIKALPYKDMQALLAGIAEKDQRIRSLENMVVTAIQSNKFYAETYYNFGDTMSDNQGSVNISGVQGSVSGVAAAGQNQNMTGVAIGQISGAVTNTISQLQQAESPEALQLAKLLEHLKAAIEDEADLNSEDKAEALEQVKVLAEAGQKPQAGMQNAAKTAIKILKGTAASLPSATAFVEACNKLLPLITKLLVLC
ncbi:pentapeptide repeat-containing protein [Gloeocapsopsis crepidinum LEGE 06123]|uniref:Pentapeptide repeat-containing protein n=1 Tax=Gloeocapsopsis crepidinum LEGE 06123 TaxID=588587 RepID=A0ABR9UKT1_9CHRO|nr:pentapeptide repeat-containing protein [Gloeocapsopsis crepidinum]MBE9188897.1 pentapeptide repeat-containing protein [Gloeocapsopsis crepidinum LEGE 06123]